MNLWNKLFGRAGAVFTHEEDDARLDEEFEEALALLLGDEVEPDVEKALLLFQQHTTENLFFIGACYYCLGNYKEAVKFFKKEIKHSGHTTQAVMAAHALSNCYAEGIGVSRSRSQSFHYAFMEGQVGGSAKDTYWLGLCQIHGLGVLPNTKEGMRLLQMAAAQGEERARQKLPLYKKVYKE